MGKRIRRMTAEAALSLVKFLPRKGEDKHNDAIVDYLGDKVLKYGLPISVLLNYSDEYFPEETRVPSWRMFRKYLEDFPKMWKELETIEVDMLEARTLHTVRNAQDEENYQLITSEAKIAGLMKNMKKKAKEEEVPKVGSQNLFINMSDEQINGLIEGIKGNK